MSVYAITLCFNNPKVVTQSIERFYESRNKDLPIKHVLVDQSYPLPSKASVKANLSVIAEKYSCILLRPERNLGLHEGWNWAMKRLPLKSGDVLIGYDPDSYPLSPGWDMALTRALRGDSRNAWASLANPRSISEILSRGYEERRVDGYIRTWATKFPVVNSICAFTYDFLEHSGGLREPTNYYGHLEAEMWPWLKAKNWDWVFLPDWAEDDRLRSETDREYTVWKYRHAHEKVWTGDFESFLAAGCPGGLD